MQDAQIVSGQRHQDTGSVQKRELVPKTPDHPPETLNP